MEEAAFELLSNIVSKVEQFNGPDSVEYIDKDRLYTKIGDMLTDDGQQPDQILELLASELILYTLAKIQNKNGTNIDMTTIDEASVLKASNFGCLLPTQAVEINNNDKMDLQFQEVGPEPSYPPLKESMGKKLHKNDDSLSYFAMASNVQDLHLHKDAIENDLQYSSLPNVPTQTNSFPSDTIYHQDTSSNIKSTVKVTVIPEEDQYLLSLPDVPINIPSIFSNCVPSTFPNSVPSIIPNGVLSIIPNSVHSNVSSEDGVSQLEQFLFDKSLSAAATASSGNVRNSNFRTGAIPKHRNRSSCFTNIKDINSNSNYKDNKNMPRNDTADLDNNSMNISWNYQNKTAISVDEKYLLSVPAKEIFVDDNTRSKLPNSLPPNSHSPLASPCNNDTKEQPRLRNITDHDLMNFVDTSTSEEVDVEMKNSYFDEENMTSVSQDDSRYEADTDDCDDDDCDVEITRSDKKTSLIDVGVNDTLNNHDKAIDFEAATTNNHQKAINVGTATMNNQQKVTTTNNRQKATAVETTTTNNHGGQTLTSAEG